MKNLVAPRWISGHFQLVDLWRQIRDVAAINPESLAETTLPDSEFDYVDLAAVDEGTIASVLVSHRFESAPSRARRITQEGDLLVATVRPLLDGHTRVPKQGFRQLIASTGYAVLRIKDPNERDLVWHLLTSRLVRRQFHAKVAGSSYPAIAESDVGEIWIPKFKEQLVDRVVRACNALQSSESILNRLIAAKREQKRGLMQQLLTGKLRFPGFTEPWKTVRLGDVADIDSELLPASTSPTFAFHYIDLSSVNHGDISAPDKSIDFATAPSRARRVLRRGDVLLSTVRPLLLGFGLLDLAGGPYIGSTGFAVIITEAEGDARFIFEWLFSSAALRQMHARTTGSSYPALGSADIHGLYLPWPPSSEREKIGALFGAMTKELNLLAQQRAAFAAQRRGLMEKLLSGEIDIQNPKETAA